MKITGTEKQIGYAKDILGNVKIETILETLLSDLTGSVTELPDNAPKRGFRGLIVSQDERDYIEAKTNKILSVGEIDANTIIDNKILFDTVDFVYHQMKSVIAEANVDGFKIIRKTGTDYLSNAFTNWEI